MSIMSIPARGEQRHKQRRLLIEHLGSDLGNAVVQLADETAYGGNRLAWHRRLFVKGMKASAFRNLPPEVILEIEADSWASMIMCIARLTDADDGRSITIRMLPRLMREDDELRRRVTLSRMHGQRHCCIAALLSDTARNVDRLIDRACRNAKGIRRLRNGIYAHRRRRGRFSVSLDEIETALEAIQDVIDETNESLAGRQLSTDEEPEDWAGAKETRPQTGPAGAHNDRNEGLHLRGRPDG